MQKLGKKEHTHRGFEVVRFKDFNEQECSIQQSSIWLEDCNNAVGGSALWIGVDDAKPMILAKDAIKLGLETSQQNGWIDYPIPDEVSLHTRIHVNREQVAGLIDRLTKWLKTSKL